MVSDNALRYLTETFGRNPYEVMLQDVNDAELKSWLIGQKTRNFWNIIVPIAQAETNPEKRAHMVGYDTYEQQKQHHMEFYRLRTELFG